MENEGGQEQKGAAWMADDDPVSKLLGELKHVDAPGDFVFHVKARIAAGRPENKAGSWLPLSVRVAMPFGLLVLLGGYFGFYSLFSPGTANVLPVAEIQPPSDVKMSKPQEVVSVSTPLVDFEPVAPDEVRPTETVDKTIARSNVKRTSSQRSTPDASGAGSFDISEGGFVDSSQSEATEIFPKGLDPNRRVITDPSEINGPSARPAKDVLSSIGIVANYSGSSWAVTNVRPGSLAERSGLKGGDLIEAINGIVLAGGTVFDARFGITSLRVLRGGKVIQIGLKP